MREIKFRFGWSILGEWAFETHTLEELIGGDVGGELFSAYETRDEYTSHHDKNGEEIYEGDIIDYSLNNIGRVEWNDNGWVVNFRSYGLRLGDGGTIIGNIYENPELLSRRT